MRSYRLYSWLLLAALAGCEDREQQPATEAPPPDTAPNPAYSAPGALVPRSDSAAALAVSVVIDEKSARISQAQVPRGEVTFVLENKGTRPHALEIRTSTGGRWRTIPAQPRGHVMLTTTVFAGIYEAYCPLTHGNEVHRDSGARVQFVVN